MAIVVRLDVMIARRKISSKDLAARIWITEANLSLLKREKIFLLFLFPIRQRFHGENLYFSDINPA